MVTIDGETKRHEKLFVKNRTVRGIHVPRRFRTCELIETIRDVSGENVLSETIARGNSEGETGKRRNDDDFWNADADAE